MGMTEDEPGGQRAKGWSGGYVTSVQGLVYCTGPGCASKQPKVNPGPGPLSLPPSDPKKQRNTFFFLSYNSAHSPRTTTNRPFANLRPPGNAITSTEARHCSSARSFSMSSTTAASRPSASESLAPASASTPSPWVRRRRSTSSRATLSMSRS